MFHLELSSNSKRCTTSRSTQASNNTTTHCQLQSVDKAQTDNLPSPQSKYHVHHCCSSRIVFKFQKMYCLTLSNRSTDPKDNVLRSTHRMMWQACAVLLWETSTSLSTPSTEVNIIYTLTYIRVCINLCSNNKYVCFVLNALDDAGLRLPTSSRSITHHQMHDTFPSP